MLNSNNIPQHYDEVEQWWRFLDKAAKGSYKAEGIFNDAEECLMILLMNQPDLNLIQTTDYHEALRRIFPQHPPENSPQGLLDLAYNAGWFANPVPTVKSGLWLRPVELLFNEFIERDFIISASPILPYEEYSSLWKRKSWVEIPALINDSLLACFHNWSVDQYCERCERIGNNDENVLDVVTCMMHLAFIWPED